MISLRQSISLKKSLLEKHFSWQNCIFLQHGPVGKNSIPYKDNICHDIQAYHFCHSRDKRVDRLDLQVLRFPCSNKEFQILIITFDLENSEFHKTHILTHSNKGLLRTEYW